MSGDGNPVEAVRARLDGGRKWVKRPAMGGPEVCLLGAASEVRQELDIVGLYHAIDVVICEQFPERPSWMEGFNDHPDTTWADVERVLDKASVAWDEQVR